MGKGIFLILGPIVIRPPMGKIIEDDYLTGIILGLGLGLGHEVS